MKARYLIISAVAAFVLVGCNKAVVQETGRGEEIVLRMGDTFDANVTTKADTRVNSMPSSLYIGRTTGSAGSSEASSMAATSKSVVSSTTINTGVYQTVPATSYNWYAANKSFAHNASGATISADRTDIIAGATTSDGTSVTVNLNHIYACLGTLTMNTQSGYEISAVSWKMKPSGSGIGGIGGTYNIQSNSWPSKTALAAAGEPVSSGSYNYYIPATYVIECTYTLTKGNYVATFTKHANVTLVQGHVNNITGTATGGAATEIVLTVSLSAWGETNHTSLTWES